MPIYVDYEGRILADCHFIQWLLDNPTISQIGDRKSVWSRLTRIKNTAQLQAYRDENNIILDFDLKTIIDKTPKSEGLIRSAFKMKSSNEVESADSDIEKRIGYASFTASIRPLKKVYLFTIPDKVDDYNSQGSLPKMKTVQLKAGFDALRLIETFWRQFEETRMLERS